MVKYSGMSISRTMLPSYVGRTGRRRVLLEPKQIFSKERMDASTGDGSIGWRIQPLLKLAWQAGTEGGHTLAFSMSNPLSLFTVKKGTNYWGYAVHRNQLPKHTVGVNEKQTQYGPGKMEKWKVFSTVWRRRVESRGWRAFPTEGIEIGIEIGGLLLIEEVYSRKTGFKEPLLLGPKIMNNAQNLTSKLDPANLFLIYVLNFGSVVL